MATIKISRPNKFPVEEAKQKIDQVISETAGKYGVKHSWKGDQLVLSGSGIDGTATVNSSSVDIEVKLGLMASAFKGKVESGINEALDKNFPK